MTRLAPPSARRRPHKIRLPSGEGAYRDARVVADAVKFVLAGTYGRAGVTDLDLTRDRAASLGNSKRKPTSWGNLEALTTDGQNELALRRRKNKQLRTAREILKGRLPSSSKGGLSSRSSARRGDLFRRHDMPRAVISTSGFYDWLKIPELAPNQWTPSREVIPVVESPLDDEEEREAQATLGRVQGRSGAPGGEPR
jgi:hypothetical protein